MTNGENSWDVPYSDIAWFSTLLSKHNNVWNVERHDDIVFEVSRTQQEDTLRILCLRQYVMTLTLVLKAMEEFEDLDIIYIGGNWNGYTIEAKNFCLENNIGLYVTSEMTGALNKDEYWSYYQRDEDGNPIDRSRSS